MTDVGQRARRSRRAREDRHARSGAGYRIRSEPRRRSRCRRRAPSSCALTDRLAARARDRRGRRLRGRRTDRSRCGRRSGGAGRRRRCSGRAHASPRRARRPSSRRRSPSKDRKRITATVERVDAEVDGPRDAISSRRRVSARAPRSCSRRSGDRYDGARSACRPDRRPRRSLPSRRSPTRPTLAVPSVAVLGPPPSLPIDAIVRLGRGPRRHGRLRSSSSTGSPRRSTRPRRVTARRCSERDDLRGLLGAYRTRAARTGLAEDAALDRVATGRRTTSCGRRRAISTRRGSSSSATSEPSGRPSAPSTSPNRPMQRDRAGGEHVSGTGVSVQHCGEPGCTGEIEDGYCNVCGSPGPDVSAGVRRRSRRPALAARRVTPNGISMKLSSTPIGSARAALTPPDPPARRRRASRVQHLGAGITTVPSAPVPDPRSVGAREPASSRGEAVLLVVRTRRSGGRATGSPAAPRASARSAAPRTRSRRSCTPATSSAASTRWSAASRTAGSAGSTSRQRPQRVRPLRRAEGPAQHRRRGRVRGRVAERQFLAEVQHPLILEIYNFANHDGAGLHRHGVRRRPVAQADPQGPHGGERREVRPVPRRPGDRLHHRDPPRVRVPALAGTAVLRLQARQRDPGRRHASS